ncbi:MAG: MFS transporter [Micromonosporaceae bacterium]|nr:MFS transporter [Micromonosporaceae bacterium]
MSFISGRSRWTDVAVISAAQLVGALCLLLVMTTQILAFEQRGAAGVEVAALVVCESLPMVLLGKPIGRLVDRVDSRVLLVGSGLVQALTCLVLAEAVSLPPVLGTVFLLAVAGAVSMPTRQALLPAMVHRDDLPRAAAIGQTASSLGMMIGPALAGVLVGTVGPQSTVRVGAVGFLVTVVAAAAIRTRRGGRTVTAGTAERGTAAEGTTGGTDHGWSLRRDPLLRACAWSLAAVIASAAMVNVALVFFVVGTLGSSPQAYGLIDAMWMVGLLFGSWLGGLAVRPRTPDATIGRALVFAVGLDCLALIATATAQSPWWIVPCYLLGGVGNGLVQVLLTTLVGRRAPSEARGRASTAVAVRLQGAMLLGFVAGGLLLAAASPRWIVLGSGVLGLLTALALLPLVVRAGTAATAATDRPETADRTAGSPAHSA